jgi:chitinase
VQIINTYSFDGIDIDWRFPSSAMDMANFSLLLSQVRDELDNIGQQHQQYYGLTATMPCMPDKIPNIDIFFLDLILNEFNLLTTDFHGPWDDKVGSSAPLFNPVGEELSVDSCVSTYVQAGASKEKINVALPFYGRSFAGAFAIGQEAKCNWAGDCSDTVTWQEDGGSPAYFNIYQKLPQLETIFDNETMATFAFGDAGIVSFDDERSICLKTEYVIHQELSGVLILELGGDLLDELSTPLLDAMNLKLLNKDLPCNGKAFMESLLRHETIVNEGRDEPIVHDIIDDEELSTVEFLYSEASVEQEYRYTCGFGEGDARKKCSKLGWQEGHEETSCNTGTCPDNQICFLSLCDVIPQAAFVKPVPKGKPKRKPGQIMTTVDASELLQAETSVPEDSTDLLEDGAMAFSCGVNYEEAESCGQPCPNGLTDCPPGQFCFWLECKHDTPTTFETTENLGPQITVQKYKCGLTRDDALTCGEDCGSSWQCTGGQDCYLVPCPI